MSNNSTTTTTPPCPPNSFSYNLTHCSCNPGFFFANSNFTNCTKFGSGNWSVGTGVSPESNFFLTTFFSLDSSIRKLTQSQAVLLVTTLIVLLVWLVFCFCLRIGKIDEFGKGRKFKIRWWIGQLDFLFHKSHWADEQNPIVRRKTELGGTFSVATWILFVGLLTALLYQVFTKRTIEVHRVKPANTPDLLSFINDLEFNITTVSSMTCSNLVPPKTLISGTPNFIDFRTFPLSTYVKYTCQNTSMGPAISLQCNSCQIPRRNHFISWQYIDLPNYPAAAVGFEFNLTARDVNVKNHVSFVSGMINSEGIFDNKSKTFRGPETNILKIQLFPQEYNNKGNLKLLQPLFSDFIPGSYFADVSGLRDSLQSSKDGLINTTLFISYQSDYIVQIDSENVLGPVSILANIGGLYAISLYIFLYLLTQCEARIIRLRNEDKRMRNILSRRRAQRNWNKVRKFVMYTWGPSNLDPTDKSGKLPPNSVIESIHGIGSLRKKGQGSKRQTGLSLEKKCKSPTELKIVSNAAVSERCESILIGNTKEIHGNCSHAQATHEKIDDGGIGSSSQNQ